MAELVRSGNEAAVAASQLVTLTANLPGKARVVFFAPKELAPGAAVGDELMVLAERGEVLQLTSLLDVVETVANGLYEKMKQAGFEFAGVVDGPKPKRQKRKRN